MDDLLLLVLLVPTLIFSKSYVFKKEKKVTTNTGYEFIRLVLNTEELISASSLDDNCWDLRIVNSLNQTIEYYIDHATCNTESTTFFINNVGLEESFYVRYGKQEEGMTIDNHPTYFYHFRDEGGIFIEFSSAEGNCVGDGQIIYQKFGFVGHSNVEEDELELPGGFQNITSIHGHTQYRQTENLLSPGQNTRVHGATLVAPRSKDFHEFEVITDVKEVLPPYQSLIICQRTSYPSLSKDLVLLYDEVKDFSGSLGSKVDKLDSINNGGLFVYGHDTLLLSGGTIDHSHIVVNSSISPQVGGDGTAGEEPPGDTTVQIVQQDHTHSFTEVSISTETNLPAYKEMLFVKIGVLTTTLSDAERSILENGRVIMANKIPSFGFDEVGSTYEVDGGDACDYFLLRGSDNPSLIVQYENMGQHQHTITMKQSNASECKWVEYHVAGGVGSYPTASCDFEHPIQHIETTTESHFPAFTRVFLLKTKDNPDGIEITISAEQEAGHQYEDEDLPDLWYIPVIIVSVLAILLLFVCIAVVGVLLIVRIAKLKKLKRKLMKGKDGDLDFEVAIGEKEIAKLVVNKKLFEIDFEEVKTIRKIGLGGSGALVMLCKYQGMKVAAKIFNTTYLSEGDSFFGNFENEVQLLISLRHPNIINFIGASLKPPRVAFLTEYCKDSLEKLITSEKLEWKKMIDVLLGITKGLSYLHGKDVIHRDIKAENVLLDSHGVPKIIDFGLSRSVSKGSSRMTKRIGTSWYISPEITLGEPYDNRCDIFSLGILMYEMIHRTMNPYGEETVGIEVKVANNPNKRPNIIVRETKSNKWWIDTMQQCWKHKMDERPLLSDIVQLTEKNWGLYYKPKIPNKASRDERSRKAMSLGDKSIQQKRGNNNWFKSGSSSSSSSVEEQAISFLDDIKRMEKKGIPPKIPKGKKKPPAVPKSGKKMPPAVP